jgi:hypothetical protein
LTDEIKYGFVLNSLFQIPKRFLDDIAANHEDYDRFLNIVNATYIIENDLINDGYVDGKFSNLNMIEYEPGFNEKYFKAETSIAINQLLINGTVNRTGLNQDELYAYINSISLSKSEMFREDSFRCPFDKTPPEINCYSPIGGNNYTGTLKIQCNMMDEMPGVYKTRVFLEGREIENNLDVTHSFLANVDVSTIDDIASLVIMAEDHIGNKSYEYIDIRITK